MISITSDSQKETLKMLNIFKQAERLERELLALDHVLSVQFEDNNDLFEMHNKIKFIINFEPSLTECQREILLNRILVVCDVNGLSLDTRHPHAKIIYYHDKPVFLDNKASAISVYSKQNSMYCSMECVDIGWNSDPKWCIRSINENGEYSYLTFESTKGYFFSDIDTFRKNIYRHSYRHPILFNTEFSAHFNIKLLKINKKCEVALWE